MVDVKVHSGRSEKIRNPTITPYILTAKGKHNREVIQITHLVKPARRSQLPAEGSIIIVSYFQVTRRFWQWDNAKRYGIERNRGW